MSTISVETRDQANLMACLNNGEKERGGRDGGGVVGVGPLQLTTIEKSVGSTENVKEKNNSTKKCK